MTSADEITLWIVENTKVTQYLLDPTHPQGASKAKYLLAFGFTPRDPGLLAGALVRHAVGNLPGRVVRPVKGSARFVFEGVTAGLDGRLMSLRTVWEDCGHGEARLLTAIPLTR